MINTNKTFFKYTFLNFLLLILLGLVFAYLLDAKELFDQTLFYIFQARDIERAKNLLAGHLIFFGPEMTGGGNLPGSLYYVLLSIALYFKSNWISAWIMQYVLAFFSAIIGATYIKSFSSRLMGLLWFILFVSAPLTFRFMQVFLNVSSLLIFTVSALVFINKSFSDENPRQRMKSFIFACLSIGLGIQFHYSIISLFLALLFMQLFASRLSLSSLPKKTVMLGILAFTLPSVPYLIWLICSKFGIALGDPGQYSGEAHKALSSIVSLIKFGFNSSPEGLGVDSLRKIISTIPFPLIFILAANFSLIIKKDKNNGNSINDWNKLKPIIICLIFSFLPYFDWYFSSQAVRYTMPFYICLIFITIILFHNMTQSKLLIKRFNIMAGIAIPFYWLWVYLSYPTELVIKYLISHLVLIFVIFFFSFFLEKFDWKRSWSLVLSFILMAFLNQGQMLTKDFKNFNPNHWALFMPQTFEWEHIWKTVYLDSGWKFEEAKKRIYYIGHHLEQEPQLFLENFHYPSDPIKNLKKVPDGYFISNKFRVQADETPTFTKYKNRMNPKGWMLKQNLQPEISEALKNGDIELGQNISKLILIVPYWVKNNHNIPQYFHNTGLGYTLTKEDLQLSEIKESEGVKQLTTNKYLFKWNESPDKNAYCSTGAFVELIKTSKNQYRADIKVVGGTISQISPWVSPNWTQAWIAPYLEINCGSNVEKFLISKSIGFRRDGSQNRNSPLLQGNNSFVAPFERSFIFSCSQEINKLSIGRESSSVETIRNILKLPPKTLSINL